jgi:hypothetical protein
MPYNAKGYDLAETSLKLLKEEFGLAHSYAKMTGYLIASVSESDAERILEIVKQSILERAE